MIALPPGENGAAQARLTIEPMVVAVRFRGSEGVPVPRVVVGTTGGSAQGPPADGVHRPHLVKERGARLETPVRIGGLAGVHVREKAPRRCQRLSTTPPGSG